jgi:O-antigen/teichoic acid export membrane protein
MKSTFRNSFLGNAAFSGALHLLVKLTWIVGLETAIQRSIGTEAYGHYFALFNLSMLLVSVLDPGLTNFFVRRVAAQPASMSTYLGSILALKLVLSLVYTLGLLVLGLILHKTGTQLGGLLLIGLAQIFFSLGQFFRAAFAAKGRFKLESLFANLDKLLLISLVIPLLFHWLPVVTFSATHYIVAQVFAGLLSCGITFFALSMQGHRPRPERSTKLLRTVLWKSSPYALLVFLMMGYVRLDGILLEFLHSPLQAGIYAGGFRFFDGFFQFTALFTTILLPVFSRRSVKPVVAAHTFFISLWLLTSLAILIAVGVNVYGENISNLLYKQDSAAIAEVLKVLSFSLVPLAWSLVAGAFLTAQGRLSYLNKIAFGIVMISFLLNLLLIPRFGALATAWIALLSHSLSSIALTWAVWQKLSEKRLIYFVYLFLFLVFCVLLVKVCTFLPAITGLLVYTIAGGVFSLLFGYMHFRKYEGGVIPPLG